MEQSYFQHDLPYKNYKYEGGLVLSYGTFSPTRLLNYCCFMIALYVIIIGQSNMLKQTNKYEWTHTYAHIRTYTHAFIHKVIYPQAQPHTCSFAQSKPDKTRSRRLHLLHQKVSNIACITVLVC